MNPGRVSIIEDACTLPMKLIKNPRSKLRGIGGRKEADQKNAASCGEYVPKEIKELDVVISIVSKKGINDIVLVPRSDLTQNLSLTVFGNTTPAATYDARRR
jgi:hypothetical protein